MPMTAPAQYNTITYLIRSGIAYLPNFLSSLLRKLFIKSKYPFKMYIQMPIAKNINFAIY